jgi:hypothetical protein
MATHALDSTHIGPAHHPVRNYLIIAGAVLMGVAVGLYTWQVRAADADRSAQLDAFRTHYGEACGVAALAEPTPRMVRDLFVRSSRLQSVVSAQADALMRGVSCDEVTRALKAADFPLPPAPRQVPSITIQPGG